MKTPVCCLIASGLMVLPAVSSTTVLAGSAGLIHGLSEVDLTGEMVYAINFSANDGPRVVNGVTFTPDTALPPGVTTVGPNNVTPWQTKPNFGSTPDDDTFEGIFEDIRWANNATASPFLEAHLNVTSGDLYKLQVLFYENGGGNRRWDIQVEGTTSVDEITSNGPTDAGGAVPGYQSNAAVLFSQVLVAGDTTLDVVMGTLDGANDGGDRNPIWQGLTLERLGADTDADLLPDAWETAAFGNLSQNGAGDPDTDGLTNAAEFNLGTDAADNDSDNDGLLDGEEVNTHLTNPKAADSDGDGLSDGAEVTVRLTNPLLADSDNDGLSDGAEVNTHGTNPLDADSDDDDYGDATEVANGTNPSNAAAFPLLSTQIQRFSGADAGEGLDLTGTFISAIRFGDSSLAGSWAVRGATFVPYHSVPALTHNASNVVGAWTSMNFPGTLTADDTSLAEVMQSIRYVGGSFNISLTGLTVGKPYKLQLLFAEQCCNSRGFDIYVEDVLVADEFSPPAVQGGASGAPVYGAAVVHGFLASDTTMNIRLDKSTVTTPGLNDPNPILNAMTLEEMTGADADADGLPDLWEVANFGNLGATPTGNPDADGLPNLGEFTNGTNPNDADSDDDTLTDGAEVNTHLSNPKAADTDSDGLSDAYEVNTSLTSPLSTDTDSDGYPDPAELTQGTSPLNAAVYPLIGGFASFFTGGDPGEGLDLSGAFPYSFNVGSPGAAPGPVGDAAFTADSEAGITLGTEFEIPAWNSPSYGSTINDDNLEFVMQSIRYSDVPTPVTVDLADLVPGQAYKLQLLFAEQCCAGRAFDVEVEGVLRVDEFNPSVVQGGAGNAARGAVVTVGFVAVDTTLHIKLNAQGIMTGAFNDRNPILNGVTLEALTLPDTDADLLPDAWEMQYFGSLAQPGAGDADTDGRTNLQEYLANTLPGDSDTDNDGLTDSAEVTAGTNPLLADTDGDDLQDGAEISRGTNPLAMDSDGDFYPDAQEVMGGADPLLNTSTPTLAVASVFTGGDAGEGLDLDGTFLHAYNLGTPGAIAGQARDVVFGSDLSAGISFSARNQIAAWHAPDYGTTAADDVVEGVMQSIRWDGAPDTVRVALRNLEAGKHYKLQLLFAETGPNRGFDVIVDKGIVLDDFFPGVLQGASNTRGALVTYEFTAHDTVLSIELDGNGTGAPDKNPILSGLTLEALPDSVPAGATLQVVSISPAGVSFTATGTAAKVYALDYSADLLTGTWVEVDDNVQMNGAGTATTTDTVPGHRTPGRGFWRLRDPVLKPAP